MRARNMKSSYLLDDDEDVENDSILLPNFELRPAVQLKLMKVRCNFLLIGSLNRWAKKQKVAP